MSRKIRGKWKKTTCYALVYEVKKDIKMRVVIERVGKGKAKFRSIMPHDKKSKLKSAQ